MCGISGCLERGGRPVEPGLVERMTAELRHRGPDGDGFYDGGEVKLGHTRLALIDLQGGQQPMGNETGDVVVVFNGEVYNFAALRRDLQARGHLFRTRSDTEVIPHAYEEWGEAVVERLRGMFAFALWDAPKRRLLLARDRLGVKPLYFALDGERLLFASELKAILSVGSVERRLDPVALHDYLSLLCTIAPRTLFQGVRALEPGSYLVVADGQLRARRYWEPALARTSEVDEDYALERLGELLTDTLRDQAVADVPVGAFLSGGIDSSLLVAYLAEGRSDSLDTFTVGFEERALDEAPFARQVAERFATRHHELRISGDGMGPELLFRILDHFDQPFGDSSAIPTWMVARETRRFVKTVISGDGGDELFGGYTTYQVARRLAALRRLPTMVRAALGDAAGFANAAGAKETARRLRKALAIAGLSGEEALCALRSYFDEPAKAALYQPDHAARLAGYRTADHFVPLGLDPPDFPSALAACDLKHRLAGDMLCKVDMMSMFHGLEVRVPLLDERIVEFALGLPSDLRLRNGTTKYLLRRMALRRLPRSVAKKPKGGFVIPLRQAAGRALAGLLGETLARPKPRLGAILKVPVLHRYAKAFGESVPGIEDISRWQLDQRVYALAALERWLGRWNVAI